MLTTWASGMLVLVTVASVVVFVSVVVLLFFCGIVGIWDHFSVWLDLRKTQRDVSDYLEREPMMYSIHPLDDPEVQITPQTDEDKYLERLGYDRYTRND